MIKDNVKQIIRSFNYEYDVLIDNVKFNTIENTRKKEKNLLSNSIG